MSVLELPTTHTMIFLSLACIGCESFYMSFSLESSTVLTINSCLLHKQNQFNTLFFKKYNKERKHVKLSGFHKGYKKITLCNFLVTEINNINKIKCLQVLAF